MADPILHRKPTVAELEADIAATQAELDKQIAEDSNSPAPAPSTPVPSTPVPSPSQAIPSPSQAIPSPSAPIPSPSAPIPSPEQKEQDYKKKFSESQREALVLLAKNKKYEQISDVVEPNEDELKLEYVEWDMMNATERKLAKESLWNRKRFDIINEVNKESKDIDAWNTKVDTHINDPKVLIAHPELEGKQEDFKIFATKPTRRGVDMEDLVLAFNGERALQKPAPKKGQMFEQGSSGLNDPVKPKNEKISVDEAAVLMQKDYKKYREYLLAGKIADE